MSSYKSIDVVIDKDGKVHIRTSGFAGPSCVKAAETLIKNLQAAGLEVKTEDLQRTEEYYRVVVKEKARVKKVR